MEKLSKIYEEILSEGGSSILYHFTNPDRLVNLLNVNKFYLTPTIASKAEASKGKMYFMSFSRTKSTSHGYGYQFNRENSVRIKVDGRKIGYNYKVMPIDYWQYPKTPDFMNNKSADEMEDRIITDKGEIDNANKYIISIDVFVGKNGADGEIISKGKELGIPIYFFNNKKDFASGDPKRAINPNIKPKDENPYREHINFSYTLGALTYKAPELKNQLFNILKSDYNISDEMLNKYNVNNDKYHEKLKYYLQDDDYHLIDLSNSLGAELHNNKTHSDKLTRFVYSEFIKDYKKSKSNSIKDYLLYKFYIGKKRQKDFNKELNDVVNKTIKNSYSSNIEKYDYQTYDVDGNSVEYFSYPPVKEYLQGKIKELSKITSNYILNDNEMFKNSWKLSTGELKQGLSINDDEINNALSGLTNVDAEDIKSILLYVIWDIDDVVSSEVNRIKDEYSKQI